MKKIIFLTIIIASIWMSGCELELQEEQTLTYKVIGDSSGLVIKLLDNEKEIVFDGYSEDIEYSYNFVKSDLMHYQIEIINYDRRDINLEIYIDDELKQFSNCPMVSGRCLNSGYYGNDTVSVNINQ